MQTQTTHLGLRRLAFGLAGTIAASLIGLGLGSRAWAIPFTIETPGGPITVDLTHAGPTGSLTEPAAPQPPSFRPPTIFAAPLPSGSGARALGLAGAFTAIADDATAASWNPAGLVHLERPEASFVVRAGRETDRHTSDDVDYAVGEDEFGSANLNYLSADVPFFWLKRNFVASLNFQEVYDFRQRFTADLRDLPSGRDGLTTRSTFAESRVDHYTEASTEFPDGLVDVDVTSRLSTRVTSALEQLLQSDVLTGLEFDQQGVIDAITPALGVEVLPKLWAGAALNVLGDNTLGGHSIRSTTRASYESATGSRAFLTDTRTTSGTYTYDGVVHVPPGGIVPFPMDVPISGSGDYPEWTETTSAQRGSGLWTEGVYEERNSFSDLRGLNATFGCLWTISRHLSLGATLDLPWTAEAHQMRTVRNTVRTYTAAGGTLLSETATEDLEAHDVEFRFPLYWAAGAVWRWTDFFYTSADVSQTWWSDFWFQAEGQEKINPLDGSAHGVHAVDDCWSARLGAEFLWVLRRTEIPFRAGMAWEQRPAVGSPDEFWGLSLGSGISLGQDPGRLILDVAYLFNWGNDVLGTLVPDQPGLSTDVAKHQVYVSGIWHF
jgi:hypothetical protein